MRITYKSQVYPMCRVMLRKFRKAGKSNNYVSIKHCFVVLKKLDAKVLPIIRTLPPLAFNPVKKKMKRDEDPSYAGRLKVWKKNSVRNCRVMLKHFSEFDSFGNCAAVRKCDDFLMKEDGVLYPHHITLHSGIKLLKCRVDVKKLPLKRQFCHDSTERSLRDRNPRINPKMAKMSNPSTAVNPKLFQSQVPLIRDSVFMKNRSRPKKLDCCSEPVSYTSYPLGRQSSILKDDEDTPRKVIPFWAQDDQLNNNNYLKEVDVDFVFAPCESPNLDAIFSSSKKMSRRNIWQSPFKIKKKREHFRRSTKVNIKLD